MSVMDSIKKFVFPAVDDIDDEYEDEASVKPQGAPKAPIKEEFSATGVKKGKVVRFNTGAISQIVVVKLDSNSGVKVIIDNLKNNIPVIFNIARLDRSDAVRVVDVVYGASYGLEGSMQKVSNDIFVVAPHNMEITGDIAEKILGVDDFSWDV
ncbi:MAG: cell division protein SepF [Clostridia bacterium]